MRTELPADRLHRRLGSRPDTDPADDGTDDDFDDDDPKALLPRWLPDESAHDGWLTRVRADPGRAGAIALAMIAAIAVLITIFTLVRDRTAPVVSAKLPPVEMVSSASPGSSAGMSAEPDRPVVVSVVGLVHKPGLVTLAAGARVADALTAAGGVMKGADTIGVNMARPLADGEQIVVGITAPPGQPRVLGSSAGPGSGTPNSPANPSASPAPTTAKSVEVINLNTATVQQLDTLPGVGPVTAGAIVAWRNAHGRFSSVEQLGEVDGIGPARLDKLRSLVRV